MATDLLTNGRRTHESYAILIYSRMIMERIGMVPQTMVLGVTLPHPEEEEYAEPVQSVGGSESSRSIDNYLRSALDEYDELESETPKNIRMTSSPEARAAQMDPWKAKNGRRIRLIKKKYRGGGLDAKETAELSRLSDEVSEHIYHVSPRSTEALEEFEDFVSELRAEVEKKRQKP